MENLLELWNRALKAKIGIAISTNDRQLLRMQLYRARTEINNAELEEIVIIFPQKENELWLVKRGADEQST